MTTLIGWIAVDARGPSGIYLASDSRITWGTENRRWDAGRKLFAFSRHPDILGYVGDVLFPTQILSQIVELGDRGMLFPGGDESKVRHSKILKLVQAAYARQHNAQDQDFDILHASRSSVGMLSEFSLWRISYSKGTQSWTDTSLALPNERSALVATLGSGADSMSSQHDQWRRSSQGGTSRAIFSAFCDSLISERDKCTGGPPQLVGLYRAGGPQAFGIVYQGVRYLYGMPLPTEVAFDNVEWRDTLFQRIEAGSLAALPDAQRHVRPVL